MLRVERGMQARAPRVVTFNVAYSENVGDGVIAECMTHALTEAGAEVRAIDLAGRTGYGVRRSRLRALLLQALARTPGPVRRRVVHLALGRLLRDLEPEWDAALLDADLAIIGGGNLLQDDDGNFPLKVAAAARACARMGVPVHVHAVGVVPGWSPDARAQFGALEACDLRGVSVRDEGSAAAWRAQMGPTAIAPLIVLDPGLMAACLADAPAPTRGEVPTVGLGVIHPAVSARHGAPGAAPASTRDFVRLARTMLDRGWTVRLFTNGAREDHAYAERVLRARALRRARAEGRLALAPRPRTARELVATLHVDGIVAHRLHALIAATGLGVPHVGLAWDGKVRGFYAAIGRTGDVFGAGEGADAIVDRLATAMADPAARLVREADARALAARAREAVPRPSIHAPAPDRSIHETLGERA